MDMSRFYFFNSSTILCFYDSSSPLPSIRNPSNVSVPWSSQVCLSGHHRNLGFFSRPTLYNQSAITLFPSCIANQRSVCSHPVLPIDDQSVPSCISNWPSVCPSFSPFLFFPILSSSLFQLSPNHTHISAPIHLLSPRPGGKEALYRHRSRSIERLRETKQEQYTLKVNGIAKEEEQTLQVKGSVCR